MIPCTLEMHLGGSVEKATRACEQYRFSKVLNKVTPHKLCVKLYAFGFRDTLVS